MCPGGAKKERKPQKHAYACPQGTKKEKEEEKRRKKPPETCVCVSQGCKKDGGVENMCWGLKTCFWWLRHMAGVDNAWLGVKNAW